MAAAVDHHPRMLPQDLALFTVPPVNVAEKNKKWIALKPQPGGLDGQGSVSFHIPGTGTQYTDLSNSVLCVRLSLWNTDGTRFVQTTNEHGDVIKSAVPVDNILHSLWRQCDVSFNGHMVSTSSNQYMYKAYFENLLNFNTMARDNQLTMVGFSGDAGNMAQTDPDGIPTSLGLETRYKWWKKIHTLYTAAQEEKGGIDPDDIWPDPQSVEFRGPLNADIFNQPKLIVNGVDIDISLWPNSDAFRLITHPTGTEVKIQFDDIYLKVCRVKVEPEVVIGIETQLPKSPAIYSMLRTEIRTYSIPVGSFEEAREDLFQNQVPNRVVMGLVDAQAAAGHYHMNPFHFQHFNLTEAGFSVEESSC